MQHVALHTRLRPGKEAEYEREHAVIPPELDALMRAHGVASWRIYRTGRDLFHMVECEDYAAFLRAVEHDPVNIVWQRRMGELLEVIHDYSDPNRNVMPLVWQLP